MSENKFAIRFGLGAIKAVGIKAMSELVKNREENGEFKDIFDFAKRINAKNINKKSIEALAKSGAFDSISDNRRQIFESYNKIASYAVQQQSEANSDQMTFFGELIDESQSIPQLANVDDWKKDEKLKKEFEAFGFFLNEHPLDDLVSDLKKRGIIFSDKKDMGESGDAFIVKMAGVVASSKHRSGSKGRFAYMTISDPLGIYEAMIFDEALITKSRDLLSDGSSIMFEAMIRKDEGGTRILIREVLALEDFIKNTPARNEVFEDIKELPKRKNFNNGQNQGEKKQWNKNQSAEDKRIQNLQDIRNQEIENLRSKEIFSNIEIFISNRDAIFNIKPFLSRRKAPADFDNYSKIVMNVNSLKIDIAQKYLIDERDIAKIRKISGVDNISFS